MIQIIQTAAHEALEGVPPGVSIALQGPAEELRAFWKLLTDLPIPLYIQAFAQEDGPYMAPLSFDEEGPPVLVLTFTGQSHPPTEEMFVAIRQMNNTPGVRAITASDTIAGAMYSVNQVERHNVLWWEVGEVEEQRLRGYVSQPDALFPNGGRWRIFVCERNPHHLEGGGNGHGQH